MKDDPEQLIDRYRGCLLGLATGDALGTALEFTTPGSFTPVDDMVGGGPFGLRPGEWTDDTSMALCLTESLIERNGFDPVDQLLRYDRWYRDGHLSHNGRCFDIGNTVRSALQRFEATGSPYCGSTDQQSAGNGSIMRLAPVPLYFARQPRMAIEKSGESSRTTHGAALCVDACRYLAALILGALNGIGKETLLSQKYSPILGYWQENPLAPEIDEIACGSFKRREPPEIKGTGYVVKSLEAALWAFHKSSSFEEGCLLAVNLGHDADTTGAVFGQIAGAFYGELGIPSAWLDKLAMRHKIESFSDRLYVMSGQIKDTPMSSPTNTAIKGFFGEFAFLGNYHPSEIGMDGISGITVEHVFQAMKAISDKDTRFIVSQASADQAKKAGRYVSIRPDWDQVRLPIMEALVREKFIRHQDLRKKLLATDDTHLEETNHWGDTFWGVCKGIGENHLGKILIKIRSELKAQNPSAGANRLIFEKLIGAGKINIRRGPIFNWAPFPVAHETDFGKIEGMMLGLAIGDSLGNGSEAQRPQDRMARFGEIRDYLPQPYAESRAVGLPSDDTQLAFWTLEHMLAEDGLTPIELARLFTSGRRIFGIGGSVRQFIRNFKELGLPWYEAGPKSSGNGALMRIAPMLIPYVRRPCSDLWVDTALSAMMTHNDSGSIAACVAFINMLWNLVAMKKAPDPMWWPTEFVRVASMLECDEGYQPRGGKFTRYKGTIWRFVTEHVLDAYRRDLSALDACQSWYSGAFLLETVPSVIYILMRHGHNLEEAIVRAVNDTRDNDTAGAIVGAAVGALHGKSAIPDRWRKNLLGRTGQDDDGHVFELLEEARVRWWEGVPLIRSRSKPFER